MANENTEIIRNGKKVRAEKLEVLTFSLGPVGQLNPLDDVIIRENDEIRLVTKEAPLSTGGCKYDENRIAVVRIICGKVLMNGMYDLYALTPENATKRLKNEVTPELTAEQERELAPIFAVASEVKAYITAKEERQVIIITNELADKIGNGTCVMCHNEWDAPDILTPLYLGDVFVVSDCEKGFGYRIGADEFAGTHALC